MSHDSFVLRISMVFVGLAFATESLKPCKNIYGRCNFKQLGTYDFWDRLFHAGCWYTISDNSVGYRYAISIPPITIRSLLLFAVENLWLWMGIHDGRGRTARNGPAVALAVAESFGRICPESM